MANQSDPKSQTKSKSFPHGEKKKKRRKIDLMQNNSISLFKSLSLIVIIYSFSF